MLKRCRWKIIEQIVDLPYPHSTLFTMPEKDTVTDA